MGNNNMSPLGPKKKKIRFNLYWMYALIALLLFGLYYANDPSMSKEVNWSEFEKIAKEGGITQVTVFAKKDYVEAQLNDSTAKAVFKTDKINGKPIPIVKPLSVSAKRRKRISVSRRRWKESASLIHYFSTPHRQKEVSAPTKFKLHVFSNSPQRFGAYPSGSAL